MDPALTTLDIRLSIEVKVWRWMRLDGCSRDQKQALLQRIDLLLEQRWTLTHPAVTAARESVA